MTQGSQCSNCHSLKIVPYAHLYDNGDSTQLQLAVPEDPDAKVFKSWHLIEIAGSLCCDCGRVWFTAVGDLGKFWEAFQKSGREVAIPEAQVLDEAAVTR